MSSLEYNFLIRLQIKKFGSTFQGMEELALWEGYQLVIALVVTEVPVCFYSTPIPFVTVYPLQLKQLR